MIRILLCTCVFMLISHAVLPADKIDSLKQALKVAKKPVDKINTLNLLGRELFLANKHDTALVLAEQAKKQSEKIDYKKGIAAAYNILGNVCLLHSDYTCAYDYHSKALAIQLKLGDKKVLCSTYNNIGIIHYYQGDLPEALKAHLNSLKFARATGDKTAEARSYSNIGGIYTQQQNFDEALKTFTKGYKIQMELKDRLGMGRSLNNIGTVYLARGIDEPALENFIACLKIKEEIGDVLSMGQTYLNVAGIYFRKGYYAKSPQTRDSLFALSEKMHQQAIESLEQVGNKQALAGTYNNLGLLYLQKKQWQKARQYLDKGFLLAKEIGSKDDLKSSYNAYAVADSMAGDFESSLANYKLFIRYRDSLSNESNTKKTMQAQMDFELEQKEIKMKADQDKKAAVYEEKLARQKIMGWSVGGGSVLFLLVILLIINRTRLKQKNEYQQQLNRQQKQQAVAIMEAQEQERKRIAEDLHDSLGHLLSAAKMNLQQTPLAQEQCENSIKLLNQASEELRNISFNLMPKVLEEEGLTPALSELAEKTNRATNMAVSFRAHDIEVNKFDKPTQFNIYRIVQEAINNILKHAGATEAGIQLIGQQNQLTIMIEDNGKGFDTSKTYGGRGQKNMRARTQWLNGNFNLDSTPGHGTTICIDIPVSL
ncbi:MAG TPA: sensor histidine kinase [Flavobacteriales bacterium]|nr:sensor histidine kinase [Flavobacteriales bacterium]